MRVTQWFGAVMVAFAACAMMVALSGCVVLLKDSAEMGVEQSSRIGFYHTARSTNATSSAELQVQALVDWLMKDAQPADAGEDTDETPASETGETEDPDGEPLMPMAEETAGVIGGG